LLELGNVVGMRVLMGRAACVPGACSHASRCAVHMPDFETVVRGQQGASPPPANTRAPATLRLPDFARHVLGMLRGLCGVCEGALLARSRSLAGQLLCAHSRLISAGRPGASPPLASATLLLPPSMLLFCGCYCCSACMMGGKTSTTRGAMRACDALLCMRVHVLVLLCVLFCARAAA
jgi:hypothetical protein